MLAVMACMTARAYDFEVDGIYYSLNPNTEYDVSVVCGDTSYLDQPQGMPGPARDLLIYEFMSWKGNSYSGDVVIPNQVTYTKDGHTRTYYVRAIGFGAFCNCRDLKSVVCPSSIEEISAGAFYNCTSLTSVSLPSQARYVGDFAFAHCYSLSELKYPKGVSYIGDSTFLRTGSDVESFTLTGAEEVTRITTYGCCGVNMKDLSAFPNLQYMEYFSFAASELEVVDFSCIDFKHAKIEASAFSYCEKIRTVILPEGVGVDPSDAFGECPLLTLIRQYSVVPPHIGKDWAAGVSADCVLEVPDEAVEAYREAPFWKNFKNIRGMQASVGAIENATFSATGTTGAVLVEGDATVSIYDASGRSVYHGGSGRISVSPGLYIVKGCGISSKVLVK